MNTTRRSCQVRFFPPPRKNDNRKEERMNCSCINIDIDDGESEMDVVEKILVARKEYTCCECGMIILPGDKYEHARGKWNGSFQTFKTCATCKSIRSAFFCNGWSYGRILEDLHDHINDTDGNISSECLSDMPKPARDEVCDMIEEYWEN